MSKNLPLHRAKTREEDEFYTQRPYIEDELSHYKDHFKGKTVYCNCDDPTSSEFWKFFVRVFKDWGLKKLMATHYEPNEKNYAYKLELYEDTNGDGKIDYQDEPTITQIPCNGDFRCQICIDLLKEADIVVTNPPFSLWRQYISQLIQYKKDFLVIGSQNAITYKDVFPLLMYNQMWLGYYAGNMEFKVPPYYTPRNTRYWTDDSGQKWRSMGNICWYTNLDIPKRHQHIDLRGNYFERKKFPAYDNYDAIEIGKVENIPCDYDGVMGVPITFMSKYSPDQFEIVGMTTTSDVGQQVTKKYVNAIQHNTDGSTTNGSKVNTRSAILRDTPPERKTYYTADGVRGFLEAQFPRILVRNKHPEQRRYPDEN